MKSSFGSMLLIAITSVGLLWAQGARAETVGTLTLSGSVAAVTELQIFDAADGEAITTYTSLNLASGGGQADTVVAKIHEKCNDPDGYTVTIASANSVADVGNLLYLKGADVANGDLVAYSLKYASVAVGIIAGVGTALVTDASDINPAFPEFTSKSLSITIVDDASAVTPNNGESGKNKLSNLPADTYSDTLTVTIAPKA